MLARVYRCVVKGGSFAFDNAQSPLRTALQAGSQTVTQIVGNNPSLAIDNGQSALGAVAYTLPAAIA